MKWFLTLVGMIRQALHFNISTDKYSAIIQDRRGVASTGTSPQAVKITSETIPHYKKLLMLLAMLKSQKSTTTITLGIYIAHIMACVTLVV